MMIKKIFIQRCANHPEELAEYKINKIPLCRVCAEIVANLRDSTKLELQNFRRNSDGKVLFRSTSLLSVRGVGLRSFSDFGREKDNTYCKKFSSTRNGKSPEEIKNSKLFWSIECELVYDYGEKSICKYGSKEYEMVEDSGLIYLFSKKECLILNKYWKPIKVVSLII
jgi:hypothetical protein